MEDKNQAIVKVGSIVDIMEGRSTDFPAEGLELQIKVNDQTAASISIKVVDDQLKIELSSGIHVMNKSIQDKDEYPWIARRGHLAIKPHTANDVTIWFM